MEILITESQFEKIKNIITEQEVDNYDEECLKDETDALGEFLGMSLSDEDLGPEMSDQQILGITKENNRGFMSKILRNLSQMSLEELKNELDKVVSLKNLKEQQTPYMERQTNIAGVKVPTAVVHGVLGIVVIAILSKMMKMFQGGGRGRYNRRQRLRDRAVGCQGGAARARLVAQRRRRENWKRFLKKIGLR